MFIYLLPWLADLSTNTPCSFVSVYVRLCSFIYACDCLRTRPVRLVFVYVRLFLFVFVCVRVCSFVFVCVRVFNLAGSQALQAPIGGKSLGCVSFAFVCVRLCSFVFVHLFCQIDHLLANTVCSFVCICLCSC